MLWFYVMIYKFFVKFNLWSAKKKNKNKLTRKEKFRMENNSFYDNILIIDKLLYYYLCFYISCDKRKFNCL